MAVLHFNDASVRVGGTDLSDHVRSVTINYGAEMLDRTAMGDETRRRLAGLKDWSVNVEFNQDFASSEVDDTLFTLVGSTQFLVGVLPTSTGVSATNPIFVGRALLETYPPLSNSVGELATVAVTLQGADTLQRKTTATTT